MYPQANLTSPMESVIIVRKAPGTQLEFKKGVIQDDAFRPEDCQVYGGTNAAIGVALCLARSRSSPGPIVAGKNTIEPCAPLSWMLTSLVRPGVYSCIAGASQTGCLVEESGIVPNVTTTMAVYERTATSICGARNNSILSVSDLGELQPNDVIDIAALKLAIGWLFNYAASDTPAMSSVAFWFWLAPVQTSTYRNTWEQNAYATLQSLLAFSLWEFNINNNGNVNLTLQGMQQYLSLPAEFQTKATIGHEYTRFVLK